ncbi:MAG: YtrH family sporulation protein [Bacillota bacterium]|nr:YtrH family sporulation protein [Bacillota bacterium]
MDSFINKLILVFFTALGVVMGAALLASLAALITQQPPVRIMMKVAGEIKIWAMVAAIGGTFTTIEILESGIFEGKLADAFHQVLLIIVAFIGAQVGQYLIATLSGAK